MKYTGLTTTLLLALLCLISSAASASTWYVNGVSGSDSNDCKTPTTACKTIRHAISLASSGDSIKVAAAIYTENLIINISLRVVGSGAGTTIVDGGGVARVVTISNASAHVTLSGMTISNGHAYSGGGIQNSGTLALTETRVTGNSVTTAGGGLWNGGTLTISSSTVSGNQAIKLSCTSGSCVVHGGGIHNASIGRLTIKNSTISGNFAGPGGLNTTAKGGGIFTLGTLTISNSTVSGNEAAFRVCTRCIPPPPISLGGGIYNASIGRLENSTISGNSAGSGGGIFISTSGRLTISNTTVSKNGASGSFRPTGGIANSGTATLQNSIVASNSGTNCAGALMISNGYNLSSDNTCDSFTGPGDLNNTDPQLGPLQNNGGPTQTMALPSGSPAVDAGNPNGCTDGLGHLLKTDQRGKPRPDPEDTGGCDMGAYERQSD